MTVSRVVNKSSYVGQETELRVRKAIAKLGFRPNPIALAIASLMNLRLLIFFT
jgi:DNA-binding LacI/PurR family transcriptional regulator